MTYDWKLPLPKVEDDVEGDCPGITIVAGLSAISGALVMAAIWVITELL